MFIYTPIFGGMVSTSQISAEMEQRMKKTDLLMAIDKANRIYTAILEVFPVFKMDKHSDLKKIYLSLFNTCLC